MNVDETLDTCGLLCPLPVLKIRKRMQPLMPGAVMEVLADDPVAIVDIPHYCIEAGHTLLSQEMRDKIQVYRIAKGG